MYCNDTRYTVCPQKTSLYNHLHLPNTEYKPLYAIFFNKISWIKIVIHVFYKHIDFREPLLRSACANLNILDLDTHTPTINIHINIIYTICI